MAHFLDVAFNWVFFSVLAYGIYRMITSDIHHANKQRKD